MDEDIGTKMEKSVAEPSSEHEEVTVITTVETHYALGHSTDAYGPNGVRGLFSSGYVVGAALLASLGGFSFGYDQGVISIINVMDQFHAVFPETKTSFGTGFMTGMLLLGSFVAWVVCWLSVHALPCRQGLQEVGIDCCCGFL